MEETKNVVEQNIQFIKKVNFYIESISKKVPVETLGKIKKILLKRDEQLVDLLLNNYKLKDPAIVTIVGGFSAFDRLLLGGTVGDMIVKMLLGYITCGIYFIVDFFKIAKKTRDYNLKCLLETIKAYGKTDSEELV